MLEILIDNRETRLKTLFENHLFKDKKQTPEIKYSNLDLGDIVISINYMNKSKNLSIYDFRERVAKIFIHGFLHLLDFDHIKKKDYIKMLNQEQKIFESVQKFIN